MNTQSMKHYTNRSNTIRALKSRFGIDSTERAAELIGKDEQGFFIKENLLKNPVLGTKKSPFSNSVAGAPVVTTQPAPKHSLVNSLLKQIAQEKEVVQSKPASKRVPKEVRNGVKRPGAKGVCGQLWAWLDSCKENGQPVTIAHALKHAESTGWNTNNVKIEFYQWRKFNKEEV